MAAVPPKRLASLRPAWQAGTQAGLLPVTPTPEAAVRRSADARRDAAGRAESTAQTGGNVPVTQ